MQFCIPCPSPLGATKLYVLYPCSFDVCVNVTVICVSQDSKQMSDTVLGWITSDTLRSALSREGLNDHERQSFEPLRARRATVMKARLFRD